MAPVDSPSKGDDTMDGSMNGDAIARACLDHTMYSWTASGGLSPEVIVGAEGIFLHTADGRRLLDFNSQLMNVNVGHGHPSVRAAMKRQIDRLPFVAPSFATLARARLRLITLGLTRIIDAQTDKHAKYRATRDAARRWFAAE